MADEILEYIWKLLDIYQVKPESNRVLFLTPNQVNKFPAHTNLSSLLYYSDDTLNDIREIVRDKVAYIVPGHMNDVDLKLAVNLKLPI